MGIRTISDDLQWNRIGPGIDKIPDSHKIQVKYTVFGLYHQSLGSGTAGTEVQIWIRILSISHKGVKQTEIMLAK
jgi:hypothetical protein